MKQFIINIFRIFWVFVILTLFILPGWILTYFGVTNFDQIWFTVNNAEGGANLIPLIDYFRDHGLVYLVSILIIIVIPILKHKYLDSGYKDFYNLKLYSINLNFSMLNNSWIFRSFLTLCLVLTGSYSMYKKLEIDKFIQSQSVTTSLYEEEYVHPKDVTFTFPDKKRNFIHIVVESMEDNYSRYNLNGETVNLIPNLSQLAKDNFTFSTDSKSTYYYTGRFMNTISGLVGLTSGNAINVPIDRNTLGKDGVFFPGAVTFGEILEDNGYSNYFYIGSDKAFAGRDVYYTTHGNYEIFDYTRAIEEGYIPEDYKVFWGFEDLKLFQYAKDKLSIISKNEEPFNFKLLTVDTHFPEGYQDASCPQVFDSTYANAIYCSDQKVSEFITWIQQQDFYENTTILITADHLTMNAEFGKNQTDRTLYHTIINGVNLGTNKNRSFTVVDWFPTSLHLLGATFEGDRLGFGTNLFSNTPTLSEKYGNDIYQETSKRSDYYTNNILRKPKE